MDAGYFGDFTDHGLRARMVGGPDDGQVHEVKGSIFPAKMKRDEAAPWYCYSHTEPGEFGSEGEIAVYVVEE